MSALAHTCSDAPKGILCTEVICNDDMRLFIMLCPAICYLGGNLVDGEASRPIGLRRIHPPTPQVVNPVGLNIKNLQI